MKDWNVQISKVKMLDDGLCVWFKDKNMPYWDYYAHQIHELGDVTSPPDCITMWGWINHMHEKIWWNPTLEEKFIKVVTKTLHG